MKEETKNKMNGKNNEEFLFTDLLAALCIELASVFKSFSRISRTCSELMNTMSEPDKLIEKTNKPLNNE